MVTVRDLSDYDDFRLDEADYALVGMRTGQKFRMGDAVRIKVVAANLSKRQLDYEWVTDKKGISNAKPVKKGGESKSKTSMPDRPKASEGSAGKPGAKTNKKKH
jgi:ribonuclease R